MNASNKQMKNVVPLIGAAMTIALTMAISCPANAAELPNAGKTVEALGVKLDIPINYRGVKQRDIGKQYDAVIAYRDAKRREIAKQYAAVSEKKQEYIRTHDSSVNPSEQRRVLESFDKQMTALGQAYVDAALNAVTCLNSGINCPPTLVQPERNGKAAAIAYGDAKQYNDVIVYRDAKQRGIAKQHDEVFEKKLEYIRTHDLSVNPSEQRRVLESFNKQMAALNQAYVDASRDAVTCLNSGINCPPTMAQSGRNEKDAVITYHEAKGREIGKQYDAVIAYRDAKWREIAKQHDEVFEKKLEYIRTHDLSVNPSEQRRVLESFDTQMAALNQAYVDAARDAVTCLNGGGNCPPKK